MNHIEPDNPQAYQSIWEHLEELRGILIKVFITIAVSTCFCFYFYEPLLQILAEPFDGMVNSNLVVEELIHKRIINKGSKAVAFLLAEPDSLIKEVIIPAGENFEYSTPIRKRSLVMLGPLEGITTAIRISFWVGLVGSSPIWLIMLLKFILPALDYEIKRILLPFFCLSFGFLSAGFMFAYWLTIPLANQYLYNFNLGLGVNFWSLAQYFDYTLLIMLANGLAAELSLILLLLVHLGVLSATSLISKRKYAIVFAFILGALLTPPDILTQVMVAIPLILLYEIAILYAKIRNYRASKLISFSRI